MAKWSHSPSHSLHVMSSCTGSALFQPNHLTQGLSLHRSAQCRSPSSHGKRDWCHLQRPIHTRDIPYLAVFSNLDRAQCPWQRSTCKRDGRKGEDISYKQSYENSILTVDRDNISNICHLSAKQRGCATYRTTISLMQIQNNFTEKEGSNINNAPIMEALFKNNAHQVSFNKSLFKELAKVLQYIYLIYLIPF